MGYENDDDDATMASGKITMRCPFHEEKTPSMVIDVSSRKFRCFSCGAHGEARVVVKLSLEQYFAEEVL